MNYNNCSTEELQKFISQRKIDNTDREDNRDRIITRLKRSRMVDKLEEADQSPEFDKFFDLPAEMRNEVYGYCLDTPLHFVNRQAHTEFKGLLYADWSEKWSFEICVKALGVKVRAIPRNRGVTVGNVQLQGTNKRRSKSCGPYSAVKDYSLPFYNTQSIFGLQWPDLLKHLSSIRVLYEGGAPLSFTHHWNDPARSTSRLPAINTVLYSLCCFLKSDSQLKCIEVALPRPEFAWIADNNDLGKKTLLPLSLLQETVELKISGLGEEQATQIRTAVRSSQALIGVMENWKHALPKIRMSEYIASALEDLAASPMVASFDHHGVEVAVPLTLSIAKPLLEPRLPIFIDQAWEGTVVLCAKTIDLVARSL